MKNKNVVFERMKKIAAKRLVEVMAMKNIDTTTVRKEIKEKYDCSILRQTFYKYRKAEVYLPDDFIKYVSAVLNIDPGYLQGNDHFIADTYQEYEKWREEKYEVQL